MDAVAQLVDFRLKRLKIAAGKDKLSEYSSRRYALGKLPVPSQACTSFLLELFGRACTYDRRQCYAAGTMLACASVTAART
jgi:hypothetical protein